MMNGVVTNLVNFPRTRWEINEDNLMIISTAPLVVHFRLRVLTTVQIYPYSILSGSSERNVSGV
jgi:hypothetical protein